MERQKYQLSPNVRIISDPESETAMVYHTLYGNPRIVNDESLRFLDFFRQPASAEEISKICDGDPRDIIREFAEIFFLVKPCFDEKKFLREKKEQQLAQVQERRTIDRMGLAISDLCNFGCAHCIHFQPAIDSGQVLPMYQRAFPQLNMTWETAKRCVDQYVVLMREQGRTHGKIHFGNAEPLVNWPVIERVLEYCSKMDDVSFEFAINTNMVLMTRQIAEAFKRYQVRIATSLDGAQTANDTIRITRGGQGTFARILKKFDHLAEIGYPLDGFSITVTRGNFELIDTDILDLAIERRMTSIAFDYDLVGLVHVPVEKRIAKLMRLKKYANEHGIDFFGTWDSPFRNLTSESLLSGDYAFCAAIQGKALEFNVDGSIKICSHTTTTVGHIDSFDEMFEEESGLMQIVASRFPGTDEYCSGCKIEGLCGGQCHVTREVVSRSVSEEQQKLFVDMCDFYRKITKALAIEYIRSNGTVAVDNRQTCTL
ncbi:radical SAM protein [Patescibacteria group bacterium]|nr:radical SAM protein [Patescibacteria group bacterium]MBU1922128.1 radical SAM protein [Patescibacteria group bacterium]